MWHKLTLFGKVLLFTTGLGLGMAIGFKAGKQTIPAQQTTIEIKDIKTKKGGTINLDTKTKQDQENKTPEKKGFFKRIFG
ncbi:hypothetical protein DWB61_03720 [Ancylomarina euxinus]|uniref:Uncharacterized protein n=1 Tax=Ancylomarina euxinus TaxID=2283627 RepID=A0A425Y705_9BACT|nr:hypothetical protein [Ancylomarina euxinus]MBI9035466.1 hypothetical protein [Bacteroidales bacterium]MCZ4693891.1 hypothetical protein [Ancylomarina euxinus]MUP14689.1 hypothetical protein [Ancylomarina euxinus]RRG24234.1 hypothetical protein DWB61_03720 [Ancylomarina euxinus]